MKKNPNIKLIVCLLDNQHKNLYNRIKEVCFRDLGIPC